MNFRGYLDAALSASDDSVGLRSTLCDQATGFPTLPLVAPYLKEIASSSGLLGIIGLELSSLDFLEREYGWEVADGIWREMGLFLDSIVAYFLPLRIVPFHRSSGDHLVLAVSSADRDCQPLAQRLAKMTHEIEYDLNEFLAAKLDPEIAPFVRLFAGYSALEYSSSLRFERCLANTIDRALQHVKKQQQKVEHAQVEQLKNILESSQIRTFFQPIFDLRDQEQILGYEALSRGPKGSLFESAEFMFSLAGNCGMLKRLENLCQSQLISSLREANASRLIFINMEPSFLERNEYRQLALFNSSTVKPHHVVLEITERLAIQDYTIVSEALDSLRELGFRIAVDDVGSGYASLESIAYLRPDFIKINDKMVNGISSDFIKQEIVKTLGDLASRISVSLIAEGIEEQKDLETLLDLGIPFGQGYLLQRPVEGLFK